MKTEKRQNPQRITPVGGKVYENAGGGRYLCSSHWNSCEHASFMNIDSGWELIAHNVVQYDDGTIEWDYSTGCGFNDGKLEEYRKLTEREKNAKTAQLWHRQMSLANAMLCFMI